jgi:C4-dicarboxylate-specific signal transduction histidine kinase
LLQPDDPLRLSAAIDEVLSGTSDIQKVDVAFVRPNGRRVTGVVHLGGSAGGAREIRHVAHFEDRTEQLIAEEEARENRERLAQVARLNTMTDLAAGIAHEINQPLTAISSYAQSCRFLAGVGRLTEGELVDALDKVSGQVQRAGEVIRRLRSFVRRRRSKAELADINALVGEAVELARTEAHFRNTEIATQLEPSLPPVVVDPVQIQQVILNLIQNALEASADARDEPMTVRTARNGGQFIEVEMIDHGTGVDPEAADRLFEPFFTTKPSGLGLGLSISRSIIASHGGRLWHSPNANRGSVFHFTLPAAPQPSV